MWNNATHLTIYFFDMENIGFISKMLFRLRSLLSNKLVFIFSILISNNIHIDRYNLYKQKLFGGTWKF